MCHIKGKKTSVLGVFTQSRKAPIGFVTSVRLSSCAARLPLEGFPRNFCNGDFYESLSIEIPNLAKLGHDCRPLHVKTYVRFIVASDI